MVFADPERIEAELVGKLYLFDEVTQAFRGCHCEAGVVVRRREAINANLHD